MFLLQLPPSAVNALDRPLPALPVVLHSGAWAMDKEMDYGYIGFGYSRYGYTRYGNAQ